MLNVKMLQCPSCGEFTLHPKRKELGYHVCVNCSTTSRWYVRNIISGKTTYCETEVIKDPKAAKKIAAMDRRTGWGSNLNKVRR